MEIKKSPKADLERKRTLWFFMGLIMNVSIFVALLECSPSENKTSVEDISKRMENVVKTTEMIPAEESAPEIIEKKHIDKNSVSDEIEVVENGEIVESVLPSATEGNDIVETPGVDEVEKPLERQDVVTDLKLLEEIPSYPGGMSKFVKWLTENLRYPQHAHNKKQQGIVVASFIINTDGSISELKIAKPFRRDCDDEVLRVLKKMEKWTPGKRKGKPCRTLFCIPIEFKL